MNHKEVIELVESLIETKEVKREVGDFWKQGPVWMVQGPKARVHFNSKQIAMKVADNLKREEGNRIAMEHGAS